MLNGVLEAAAMNLKPNESSPAIEVENLSKVFKSATAVDRISFRIAQGSITGLLGGNGAGKTTTIGMIMGLILPSSGSVRVLGHDMKRDRHRVLARMKAEPACFRSALWIVADRCAHRRSR
jgi:ABC-2 type transport system ATP-binding protein